MTQVQCPNCSYVCDLTETPVCEKCHYRFVFIENRDMSDGEWKALMSAVSNGDRNHFCIESMATWKAANPEKHKSYPLFALCWFGISAMCYPFPVKSIPLLTSVPIAFGIAILIAFSLNKLRRWVPKSTPISLGSTCVLAILIFGMEAHVLSNILALIGSASLARHALRDVHPEIPSVSFERFKTFHKKWRRYHRHPKLITGQQTLSIKPNRFPEKDIHNYGFESALIVDDPVVVDLLIKNDFHAISGIPVFSACGYPRHLQNPLIAMLNVNPNAKHFLLHGTIHSTTEMIEALNEWGYRPNNTIDLGLTTLGVMSVPLFDNLNIESKNRFPLTAIPPKMLKESILSAIKENNMVTAVFQRVKGLIKVNTAVAEVQEE